MKAYIKTTQMRKLTLLILLFTGMVNAQIVNIPDANFKNRLVNTECVDNNNDGLPEGDVDTNDDGEIQISEAINIIQLNIQNNNSTPSTEKIQNIVGIEYFTNLERLNCSYNKLTNLNINNENLKYLVCSFNELTSFNTNNNIHLTQLSCKGNLLTSLNVDNNLELVNLDCDFNQLPNLSINNNILLETLNCSYNFLTTINVVNNTLFI